MHPAKPSTSEICHTRSIWMASRSVVDSSIKANTTNIHLSLELRASLYALFITHGTILDIVTKKSSEMREQAFIVYDNVASATAALRSLQNTNFYNKPMVSRMLLSTYVSVARVLIGIFLLLIEH